MYEGEPQPVFEPKCPLVAQPANQNHRSFLQVLELNVVSMTNAKGVALAPKNAGQRSEGEGITKRNSAPARLEGSQLFRQEDRPVTDIR